MEIIDLDEYSLRLIFSYLEPSSYLNIMYSCKTFHRIALKCANKKLWMTDIHHKLVQLISNAYNRDDSNQSLGCRFMIELTLKALLHTVKMINFIKYYKIYAMSISHILCELLLQSVHGYDLHIPDIVDLLVFEFDHSFFNNINISHWFTFQNPSKLSVIIFSSFNNNECLFGIYNKELRSVKYYYLHGESCTMVSRINGEEWSWESCSSDSSKVLMSTCDELCKCFTDAKGICINQSTVLSLSKLSLSQNIYLFDNSPCQTKNILQRRKGINKKKMKVIIHLKSVFYVNVSKLSTLLPTPQSADIFPRFVNYLKLFCSLTEFCEQEDFIVNLIHSVKPFYRVFMLFGYGELLAYIPVVTKLLLCIDLCTRVDYATEKLTIVIMMDKKLCLSADKEALKNMHTAVISIHVEDELNFDWCLAEDISEEENFAELIHIFNDYVEHNFTGKELDYIPEISARFLQGFFQCLLAV